MSVRYAGDVNDDGITDIIVSALSPSFGSSQPSEAYHVFGNKTISNVDLSGMYPRFLN